MGHSLSGEVMVRVVVSLIFFVFNLSSYAEETETRLFRPFTEGANHAAFKIKSVLKGNCFQQSKIMPREDAWQCKAGGKIYDPCFKKPGKNKMLFCPKSPWNGDSTVIEAEIVVNNDLFKLINMAEHLPWVVVLDNGNICKRTVSGKRYDQQPIQYICQDNTFLFGRLQRCRANWSMLRYDGNNADTAVIRQAWF